MKNEISISCVQRGEDNPYQLEVNLEGKQVVLLQGTEAELIHIYEDIVKFWESQFISGYNLTIKPYVKNHMVTGRQKIFHTKEENEPTDS